MLLGRFHEGAHTRHVFAHRSGMGDHDVTQSSRLFALALLKLSRTPAPVGSSSDRAFDRVGERVYVPLHLMCVYKVLRPTRCTCITSVNNDGEKKQKAGGQPWSILVPRIIFSAAPQPRISSRGSIYLLSIDPLHSTHSTWYFEFLG